MAAVRPPQIPAALTEPALFELIDGARHAGERWADATPDLAAGEAEGVRLEGCALERVDLTGARLPGLELRDCRLTGCSLANVLALRADLVRVELRGCRLTGLDLAEVAGGDVLLEGCRADLSSLRFAKLTRATFRDCLLARADLGGADLRGAAFEGCDLSGAELSGARLERATLVNCRLDGVRGIEALRGVRMAWPDVVGLAAAFAAQLGIELLDDEDRA
ncbi:MAG TPA: pentapeptide repeat-containing protein [Solirubrobacteraceae bacterium]|jgi:uncharacterized protein YjbI with pentapeptide repeats